MKPEDLVSLITEEPTPIDYSITANNINPDKSIVLLGDSTIDNKIWVDGITKNYFRARLGIEPDDSATRIKKAKNSFFKPELSVVEHLTSLLPDWEIKDFSNDGFNTEDCRNGAYRDKVFGMGTFPQFRHEFFDPLNQKAHIIKQSNYIILSVGGNDIREFLMRIMSIEESSRQANIKISFETVIRKMQENYLSILQLLKRYNDKAHFIIMTQYYPSFSQNNYKIYPFMAELGKALNIGKNPTNPMDVIHELMKRCYTAILQSEWSEQVSVVDITSSLNPFDKKNHVSQIEPSGAGGKKIAQMLKHVILQPQKGQVFQFQEDFFTHQQEPAVQIVPFKKWQPKHPLEFIGKACHNPTIAINLLKLNRSENELNDAEINQIKENQSLSQALIVLHQIAIVLVTHQNMRKIMQSEALQMALSAAHGYLNSGRFGFFHTHGEKGKLQTEIFIRNLLQLESPNETNVRELMCNWLSTSNVNNSSRTFYAFKSGLFPAEQIVGVNYVNNSSAQRKELLNRMKRS